MRKPASIGVSGPSRTRAYIWSALAVLTCPCHLPLLLALLAQSARSCDFGHLGEHVGNGLVVVD
ncbi:hypothetical protein, partial [Rhizorhapis sp. SPR117]|uniref:hypothetical protein n=1 Tax=Rhizorhapis sp. SPR117 TaxID=2912611 RepID=UPI00403EE4A4|nr:hypothetical protein [Rhizorhapis sp. SPR117]